MAGDDSEVLQRFLDQPAEHGVNDDVPLTQDSPAGPRGSWRSRPSRFFFEKEPGQYSSISPRRADGTRIRLFFFNGNGRGR